MTGRAAAGVGGGGGAAVDLPPAKDSSKRMRMLGGTTRPDGAAGRGSTDAAGAATTSPAGASGARSCSATSRGTAAPSESTATSGTARISAVGCSSTDTGASGAGAGGLTVLTRRGGPRTGAIGLGGSVFLGTGPTLLPRTTGVSANMSPPGSEVPRCRARRSTNCRPTTSSMVLDALLSSMP